jgi:anti-sigma regulatory factor (Ser/Thr protein kinase)
MDRLATGRLPTTDQRVIRSPLMKTAVDLEFNPSPSVPRTARDAARALSPPISERRLDDVRLLISEMVTNSIRHAGMRPEEWIRVRMQIGGGRVRIEVSDPGAGFERPLNPEPLSESGWGMYLLEEIADRWGVDRNGATRVWFEIDL